MTYGNTGAGLVDVDIPENPLYKQALPDLKAVSASAWGLPSLDDITVPTITEEKDIQTDTDLTDKYFELAQKLKDYAIKGRAVGIDVTKPKNNPTHLQYATQWNKMYQDFLQTGKELKAGRQNQTQFEKLKSSPNAIVGSPDTHQLFTNELLNQYSLEAPFASFKPLQEAYKKPISVYGEQQAKGVLEKWKSDVDGVQATIDKLKVLHPELADKIETEGWAVKNSLMPPLYDNKFSARLQQDMRKHLDNLGAKYASIEATNSRSQQLPSDYPSIVLDLITGNHQSRGSLLKGVTIGQFQTQTGVDGSGNPKIETVDDVIKDVNTLNGTQVKEQLKGNFKTHQGTTAIIEPNATYVVIYKTGGNKVIKVKNADGSNYIPGIQDINSLQRFYDKQEVTPTTDFKFNDGVIELDESKSNKQFTKPNTTTNKTKAVSSDKEKTGTNFRAKYDY